MSKKDEKSPFVAIGASIGGLFVGVVALFLIFAQTQVVHLVPIAWAMVVLGIGVAFFQYLSSRKKK